MSRDLANFMGLGALVILLTMDPARVPFGGSRG